MGFGWSGGWRLVAWCLPDLVLGSAGQLAAQCGDGVCAGGGPVHAGEFEALPDDRLAPGFNDTGPDEQAAGAEPVVAHAGCVVLEVAQGGGELVFLGAFEG